MSWYGLEISAEFVAFVFLIVVVGVFIREILRPIKARAYLRRLLRCFWRQDTYIQIGLFGSLSIGALVIFVSGFDYCVPALNNEPPVCRNKLVALLEASPNEFGDALAGVAGTLAFLWIIITVLLQSKELGEQRKELGLQRSEFETMNSLADAQRFETSFFELISTHNQLVQDIDLVSTIRRGRSLSELAKGKDVPPETRVTKGRDCFTTFYRRLSRSYKMFVDNGWAEIDLIYWSYEGFWSDNQQNLSHYYRFLFNAFRMVSEFPQSKPHHGKLLRALLSDQELLMIFYNCLSQDGEPFQDYAIEFDLFDNLPVSDLLDLTHIKYLNKFRNGEKVTIGGDST